MGFKYFHPKDFKKLKPIETFPNPDVIVAIVDGVETKCHKSGVAKITKMSDHDCKYHDVDTGSYKLNVDIGWIPSELLTGTIRNIYDSHGKTKLGKLTGFNNGTNMGSMNCAIKNPKVVKDILEENGFEVIMELNESSSNFKEIFQKRWEAINDLEDQGIRNLKINSDATLTLYHLTPKENVDKIKSNGFKSGSYFSITKKNSYKGDSSSIQAIQKFGDSAELMEIKVDPRFLEPINNNKDLYSKTKLILKDNVFSNQLNESLIEKIVENLLQMNNGKNYLQEFKNGRSILDYNYAYKNWYNIDLDKLDNKQRKIVQSFLKKSEKENKLVHLSNYGIIGNVYSEVSYTKNPRIVGDSILIPLGALYE